jgi:nucleoside phosphorylase
MNKKNIVSDSPLLNNKYYNYPTVFPPSSLLREARRQKSIPKGTIPKICILDPDGDLVEYLIRYKKARINPHWPCYHTKLYNFIHEKIEYGILGCAVGSSFAVLVAEELFVTGCHLLISITSAGQILPIQKPPYFILIEKALRDEGTSYHYLPPANYSFMPKTLHSLFKQNSNSFPITLIQGSTWTTDAPFRETDKAIDFCRKEGILAVEMEAAALYAYAEACHKSILCFAHVTNQMGKIEGDFEKGDASGSIDSLKLITCVARIWDNSLKHK